MQNFTGWEYLLIDACNHYGGDKWLFQQRIDWAMANIHDLEALADTRGHWKEKPLYLKAVQAIRKAQKGIPTGHLVGFDACASGIQIMSAITGCIDGARATGMVDPDTRADVYSITTDLMNDFLHQHGISVDVPRDKAKKALMTCYYGSKKEPMNLFGQDTPELEAFYQAAFTVAPGAWELLQDLLMSWQSYALVHAWKLPDGYDARVKVMVPISEIKGEPLRIEVDELDHATFSYEYYENVGTKKGLSNAANVVHSIDAYVLRCIHRRCNYDRQVVEQAVNVLEQELVFRRHNIAFTEAGEIPEKIQYYIDQYNRSGMADVVIFPHIWGIQDTQFLSTPHLEALVRIGNDMLSRPSFYVIGIHDELKCHANHMNHLRYWYKGILAELAESNILSDILSQIHGVPGTFPKLSTDLGEKIRGSNYALS